MHEDPTHPLTKRVPGHLFRFEEKLWGMTLHQLIIYLSTFATSFTVLSFLPGLAHLLLCILITGLVALLVQGKIAEQTLGTWLWLGLRYRLIARTTRWRSSRAQMRPTRPWRPARDPSVQATWIPLDFLQEGIMGDHTSDKSSASERFWLILEVEGRNVRLLPESDQLRLLRRYETFLAGLSFPLHWLTLTEQLDPQRAPALLAAEQALGELDATPRLAALQQVMLGYARRQMPTCTRNRHFVVVSVNAAELAFHTADGAPRSAIAAVWDLFLARKPKAVSRAQVLAHLRTRTSVVTTALHHLDLAVRPLDDAEGLAVLATCLAPGQPAPSFVPSLFPVPMVPGSLPGSAPEGPAHAGARVERGQAYQLSPRRYQKAVRGLSATCVYRSPSAQARIEPERLDLADLLAPSSVEIRPDVIVVQTATGTRYLRTIIVSGYGHTLRAGWIADLLELGLPSVLSCHLVPLDPDATFLRMERHLLQLESQAVSNQKHARLTGAHEQIENRELRQQMHALADHQLKLFQVSLVICLHAGTLQRLEERSHYLLAHLRTLHLQARPARLRHDLAWQSCLPLGRDLFQRATTLPSDVLATFLPATSSVIGTPTGALLGYTGSGEASRPVYFHPWSPEKKLPNPHVVIIGETGSGKSWLGKVLVAGLLGQHLADVVVLDHDNDYLKLHEQLGPESQRIALTRTCPINPFDLPYAPQDIDPDDSADLVAEFLDHLLLPGLALMVCEEGARLSRGEEAYLLHVARATYEARGLSSAAISRHPDLVLGEMPTFADFLAQLTRTPASVSGMQQSLLERLEKASYLFQGGQTAISLHKPLTIFSIKDLDETWYPLMAFAVHKYLMRHRAFHRDAHSLAYVVEEASYLLRHPAGRLYLERGARSFRKLGIAQITLSQHPRDFLEDGQVVLSNAGTAFFLGMHAEDARLLHLPEPLSRLLITGKPGQGVMRCGREYAPLTVATNPLFRDLFTTDPVESSVLTPPKPTTRALLPEQA